MDRSSFKPLKPRKNSETKIKKLLNLPSLEDQLELKRVEAFDLIKKGQVDKGLQKYLSALDEYCKQTGDWIEGVNYETP